MSGGIGEKKRGNGGVGRLKEGKRKGEKQGGAETERMRSGAEAKQSGRETERMLNEGEAKRSGGAKRRHGATCSI